MRNARQARGLSLEEIEAATRIRRRYLEALEAEAFQEIPGPAYVKGFLRAYATYLGVSPDELVALYPELSPGGIAPPEPAAPRRSAVEIRITPATPRSRTRPVVLGITAVAAIGIALLAYTLYIGFRQFVATSPQAASGDHPLPAPAPPGGSLAPAAPAAPAPAGASPAKPPAGPIPPPKPSGAAPASPPPAQPPPTAPGAPKVPASTPPAPAPPGSLPAPAPKAPAPGGPPGQPPQGAPSGAPVLSAPLHLVVVATDRTWLRAVADGATVFEGELSAGAQQTWDARQEISLKVGNAGAVDVSINGRPLGALGKPGDVVDRTFTVGSPVNP